MPPSALPAILDCSTFITNPIPAGPAAFVSAIASAIIFLLSASLNCSGKYCAITAASAFSLFA